MRAPLVVPTTVILASGRGEDEAALGKALGGTCWGFETLSDLGAAARELAHARGDDACGHPFGVAVDGGHDETRAHHAPAI